VDYFKRLGKTIKILVRRASSSANIWNQNPSNYDAGMLTAHTQNAVDYYFEYFICYYYFVLKYNFRAKSFQ
jgi:hypothetical protein